MVCQFFLVRLISPRKAASGGGGKILGWMVCSLDPQLVFFCIIIGLVNRTTNLYGRCFFVCNFFRVPSSHSLPLTFFQILGWDERPCRWRSYRPHTVREQSCHLPYHNPNPHPTSMPTSPTNSRQVEPNHFSPLIQSKSVEPNPDPATPSPPHHLNPPTP